jgi:hypothetical protein
MFFIDDLLIGLPAKGLVSVFKKIHQMAEAEVSDESKIKEELLRLQTMYEIDQISDQEYQKREAEVLARLTAVRDIKGGDQS